MATRDMTPYLERGALGLKAMYAEFELQRGIIRQGRIYAPKIRTSHANIIGVVDNACDASVDAVATQSREGAGKGRVIRVAWNIEWVCIHTLEGQ